MASIALLASVAQADTNAQAPIKIPNSGWYVSGGLGAGFGVDALGSIVDGKVVPAVNGALPAVKIDLGYKFNPYFAMGIDSLVVYDKRIKEITEDSDHKNTSGVAAPTSLYFKGIVPLSDRWDMYAKLGLGGVMGITMNGHGSSGIPLPFLNTGLGVDYQLTHALAVGLEANYAVIPFRSVAAMTANVTYYFGS